MGTINKKCGNCKHFTRNPILRDRGWCGFDKVSPLILEDKHCDRWKNNREMINK